MSPPWNPTIFRAGWTERIIYQLSHDGTTFDITGMTIALVGSTLSGVPLAFSGTVGILDGPTSQVYFDPAPTDLSAVNSPYALRWSVTDTFGKVAWFPRSGPLNWVIQIP